MVPGSRQPSVRSTPVEMLDDLELAGQHRVERPLAALVHGVLAGMEPDVGGGAHQPVDVNVGQAREQRDGANFVRCQHRSVNS
jgi:hypothetical protein